MADLDPDVMLEALRKEAREKLLTQRLNSPEFEKDQLRVDQKVKENNDSLSGFKFPDQAARNEMGRAVMKKLDETGVSSALKKVDDFGRVLGNPFGAGDALESAMTGRSIDESRAATAASKERLGGIAGNIAEVGGEIAAASVFAPATLTVKGAAAAGALTSVVADTADKWFKEDRLPTLSEAMVSAGLGTGIGALGQVFGNRLARWFVEKGAAKTPITMGAQRLLENSTKQLTRAFQFADDSGATIPSPVLYKFIVDLQTNKKFIDAGLDASVDKGAWNGLNVLRARIGRLDLDQGLTLRELADIRTGMRDVAARGSSRSNLIFDMDQEFSKMVMKSLHGADPKAKLAWQMIDKFEKQKIQGEFLQNLSDRAELASASGTKLLDKELQREFFNLVESDNGRKMMVKLGFSPEQKELFREAAHGTSATIFANKMDRVMGSTFLAPFYRISLQPLLRSRGGSTSSSNVLEVLGTALDTPKGDIVPAAAQNMGQVTAPIAPQLADPAQNAILPQPPNPSAGQVAPSQAPMPMPAQAPAGNAPAPNTGPQRMPRPFTPQTRSAVPNLPKP